MGPLRERSNDHSRRHSSNPMSLTTARVSASCATYSLPIPHNLSGKSIHQGGLTRARNAGALVELRILNLVERTERRNRQLPSSEKVEARRYLKGPERTQLGDAQAGVRLVLFLLRRLSRLGKL